MVTVSLNSKEANLQRAAIGFTRSRHDIVNACRRNPVTGASQSIAEFEPGEQLVSYS